MSGYPGLSAIGAIAPANPIDPVSVPGIGVLGAGSTPTVLDPGTADATSGTGSGFASILTDSLQNLQNLQTRSDQLAVQAADGDLQNVHDYTIAATEASLATQLTIAVRDKALAAFSEIMRMQG